MEANGKEFVYNNFDIIYERGNREIITKSGYIVSVHEEERQAEPGVWLSTLPIDEFEELCTCMFRENDAINRIVFRNYPLKPDIRYKCSYTEKNHWNIELPEDAQELEKRLSAKKRYNIKREKRIAREEIGEYSISEYTSDNVPREIITHYFEYKRSTYGIDYHMSESEYLKRFYVSHVYVLSFGELIGAIICSCEQGSCVYLENLTYNPEYGRYSLGVILYDEYLKILTAKHKKQLYLGYGHQQYKALYGAQEKTVYTGTVYRYKRDYLREVTVPYIRRKIVSAARRMIRTADILNLRRMLRKY